MLPANAPSQAELTALSSLCSISTGEFSELDPQTVSAFQRKVSPVPSETTASIVTGSYNPDSYDLASPQISSRSTSPAPSDAVQSVSAREEGDSDYEQPKPKRRCKPKSKGKKTRANYSNDQVKAMESVFTHYKYLSSQERELLGNTILIRPDQVNIWLQNRRTKYKKNPAQHVTDESQKPAFSQLIAQIEKEFKPVRTIHALKVEALPVQGATLTQPVMMPHSGSASIASTSAASSVLAPQATAAATGDTEPKYSEDFLKGFKLGYDQGVQRGLTLQFYPAYYQDRPEGQ